MTQNFRQELAEKFKDDTSDELLDKLRSGNLIALAQEVAKEELKSRGIEYIAPAPSQEDDSQDQVPWDEFETIATFASTTDAHILQGQLEAEGIPVLMPDSHLGVANSFLLSTFSSIRVQVPKSFAAQATEVVRAIQEGKFALDETEQADSSIEQSSLSKEEALVAFSQDPIWLKIWQRRINKSGMWAGFNPFAAVFGTSWFFYRKMYGWGLILLVVDWLVGSSLGAWGFWLLVRVPFGFLANIAYFKKAEKAVVAVQAAQVSKDAMVQQLKRQGGISVPGFFFGMAFKVASLLMFSSLWR
ncbi:MAG: DUF2007 domain-containing protein [Burkholderiales bacterium]|nr:DUF2007 domain-containing protein [Burkholderiales bacterium]